MSTPNVFGENCCARVLLETLAHKWTLLVVYALMDGVERHSDLLRKVEGISQKMLTQTLRELERDGLVERTVFPSVPPRVDYRLTALGESLRAPLDSLCRWSEANADEVQARRRAHVAESKTQS